MTKRISIVYLSFYLTFNLVSCNAPSQSKQQETSEFILTSAAETVSIELTQRASLISSTPKPTLPPTLALDISKTPAETTSQLPTSSGGIATITPAPCNMAKFLTDVTYPDDTEVQPGTSFIKTWRLKNAGTCSWTSDYQLIYYQGERMNAPEFVPLTNGTVRPGESLEVSISLKAPTYSGTFQTSFLLRSADGTIFGVGQHGDQEIYLRIKVNIPTSTPTITPSTTQTYTLTPATPVTALPDLQITTFTIDPAIPIKGQPVNVKITVMNKGSAAAGTFKVKWWPSESFADPACIWDISSVNPNGSQELQCDYPGYPDTYTNINTKVFVDADNSINESNEANNVALMNIKVYNP